MRNLLAPFHPDSYSIVTVGGPIRRSIEAGHPVKIYKIMSSLRRISARLDDWGRDRQLSPAVSKLVRLIKRTNAQVIVGVYPSFHFLKIAREAARISRVSWIAYLHDTIAEGLAGTAWASQSVQLQEQVFAEASSVLVMSQGMADLYRRKYELFCQPLEHTYPEPIPEHLPESTVLPQAFWGGDVYNINGHAVGRVAEALRLIGRPLVLATRMTTDRLSRLGIGGEQVRTTFYTQRADYLEALQQQEFLVLALDWPDESPQHEDELATIFPTKTPEYLASGRPILVHCPEHYFLARFFRENQCGLVVTERSVEALVKAGRSLLADSSETYPMRQAALVAAQRFDAAHIAGRFQNEVQLTAQS